MNHPAVPSWPTTLFRPAHPTESAATRPLLGLDAHAPVDVYVLVDTEHIAGSSPLAAVAVEIRDGTWLVRGAYGVDEPRIATRVGNELLSAAVRSGAVTVAAPAEAGLACRSLLVDAKGRSTGGWIVIEL